MPRPESKDPHRARYIFSFLQKGVFPGLIIVYLSVKKTCDSKQNFGKPCPHEGVIF